MYEQANVNGFDIDQARQLVQSLEAGDVESAESIMDSMTRVRESGLYQEIGKLTRELHNALRSFELDDRISELASDEIPDAKARLSHVINMTDEAANKTLTAVEDAMPVCDDLKKQAEDIEEEWIRFMRRDMEAEDFRGLCRRLSTFIPEVSGSSQNISGHLSTVLMAQEFQDLTGQVIRRVISLVGEVEDNLVNLVRLSGKMTGSLGSVDKGKGLVEDSTKAEGPQIPGVDKAEAVRSQDEVDDLLSSLGF
ncbi:MAG: protein phosphatase CheZ [Gammaproteobacteria bacterium]|nr:protein phosphatase CheZ [Gammaproteobacteria bacterium]